MKKTILLLMLVVSGFAYAEPEAAPPTYRAQSETLKDSQAKSTNQQDLMEIYQQALANDPTLASALNANKAAQEIIEQGKALYRPSINFNASGARSNTDIRFLEENIPGGRANFNTYRATIEARQPIYNKQNLVQIDQAETQVSQADKQYHLSQQQLITRVTEAYFDVLIAQDQIGLIEAQKEAILSQLEQAKATFEVGTATITDVNEAQARYDLVVSQEIAARNQYLIAQRAIQAITGQLPESLSTVKADINVVSLQEGMEDWQEIARKNNLNIQIQQDALKLAEQQVELANCCECVAYEWLRFSVGKWPGCRRTRFRPH